MKEPNKYGYRVVESIKNNISAERDLEVPTDIIKRGNLMDTIRDISSANGWTIVDRVDYNGMVFRLIPNDPDKSDEIVVIDEYFTYKKP